MSCRSLVSDESVVGLVTLKDLAMLQWMGNDKGKEFLTKLMPIYNRLNFTQVSDNDVRDMLFLEVRKATGNGKLDLQLYEFKKIPKSERTLALLLTIFTEWHQEREEAANNERAPKKSQGDNHQGAGAGD
jgi:hypothetical protein